MPIISLARPAIKLNIIPTMKVEIIFAEMIKWKMFMLPLEI